jgi:hypothetical protein
VFVSTKERILGKLEHLSETQAEWLETELERLALEREFELLDQLAEPMSEEDRTVFEQSTQRRPWRTGG